MDADGQDGSQPPGSSLTPKQCEVLKHEASRTLIEIIQRRPGVTASQLVALADLSVGGATRHLAKLESVGLIASVWVGRRHLYYPNAPEQSDALKDQLRAAPGLALLQVGTARDVASQVAEHPGLDIRGIAEALERSPRVVYHHVRRLVEAGLLRSKSTKRYTGLSPTPRLLQLLRSLREE